MPVDEEEAEGLDAVANAIYRLAQALTAFGLNGAGTHMGAVEVLAMEIKEGSERMASAISDLAEAIREREE
jgi:hypothetical protein